MYLSLKMNCEKNKILLVDDIPSNLKILALALKDEHKIQVATNGKEALRIASTNPLPDLILLDVMMPEMDGYEVCQRLKENGKTNSIPVIFVTALNDSINEEHGLSLGAEDFFRKPYSVPLIKHRVKAYLELKKYREQLNG